MDKTRQHKKHRNTNERQQTHCLWLCLRQKKSTNIQLKMRADWNEKKRGKGSCLKKSGNEIKF